MKKPKPFFHWVVIVAQFGFFLLPILFYTLYYSGVIQSIYHGHSDLSPSFIKISLSIIIAMADIFIAVLLIKQRWVSLPLLIFTLLLVFIRNVSPYLNSKDIILLITPIEAPAMFGSIVRFVFCSYAFRLKRKEILI